MQADEQLQWHHKSAEEQRASVHQPINRDNKGFQLLTKLGWTPDTGLGRRRQGIVEPVILQGNAPFNGATWGLGLEAEEARISAETTSMRKRLASEIQIAESEEEIQLRLNSGEKAKELERKVQEEFREMYCDLCKKQYQKIVDFERHLSSYDHNHKKASFFLCHDDILLHFQKQRLNDMKEQHPSLKLSKSDSDSRIDRDIAKKIAAAKQLEGKEVVAVATNQVSKGFGFKRNQKAAKFSFNINAGSGLSKSN